MFQVHTGRAVTGKTNKEMQWSGKFNQADTRKLLRLNPGLFCLDRFKEKRWCYMGIFHPDVIFGCAVVHLGYLCSAFVFGFDRQERKMIEHSPVFFPVGQVRFDRNPENGICRYKSFGGSLTLVHHKIPAEKSIQASFNRPGRSLEADIEVTEPNGGISPMHFLLSMEQGRQAFTTKVSGLKARGKIVLNNKVFDLSVKNTFAVFDWTNGFYPRQTFWNWACGAGLADDGRPVGFNFSTGVYENGLKENTVWLNGTPFKQENIVFDYDASAPEKPWQIKSCDDQVQLTFIPEGLRQKNDNLGFIKSRFIQPCGSFKGTININGQAGLNLSRISGVVEDHFAQW